MLSSKSKFKSVKKGRIITILKDQKGIMCDTYKVKALEPGILTERQIETIRKFLRRKTRKLGRLWLHIFADKPKTKKPEKVRMGKGKGRVALNVCFVRPGKTLFEFQTDRPKLFISFVQKIKYKLPFRIKLFF